MVSFFLIHIFPKKTFPGKSLIGGIILTRTVIQCFSASIVEKNIPDKPHEPYLRRYIRYLIHKILLSVIIDNVQR